MSFMYIHSLNISWSHLIDKLILHLFPALHTHTESNYPQQWVTGSISLAGFKPSNSFPSQPKDNANSLLWSLKYYIIWSLPDSLFYYSLDSPRSGRIDLHSVPAHTNLVLPLGFLYLLFPLLVNVPHSVVLVAALVALTWRSFGNAVQGHPDLSGPGAARRWLFPGTSASRKHVSSTTPPLPGPWRPRSLTFMTRPCPCWWHADVGRRDLG